MQGYGQGSCTNEELRPEILSNANTTTSRVSSHPDLAKQPADGGRNAWCYKGTYLAI